MAGKQQMRRDWAAPMVDPYETDPEKLKILMVPDELGLPDVGLLDDGMQFWLDWQFVELPSGRHVMGTSYVFDSDGKLARCKIVKLCSAEDFDAHGFRTIDDFLKERRAALGVAGIADIAVRPFLVANSGVSFGLSIRERDPDDPPDDLRVDVEPSHSLQFYMPWNGGFDR